MINEAWRLAPWADVLYACDAAWWIRRGPRKSEFTGRRLSSDAHPPWLRLADVETVTVNPLGLGISSIPGVIDAGGNSGFQAVGLAVQWGARAIILAGLDYSGDHWHPPHGPGLNNPDPALLAQWSSNRDAQAHRLEDLGVSIIDTALEGALQAFPKMSLAAAIAAHT